ncbi:MAG: hypothetical protein CL707_00520 [Chloroflexi bacterium]|nr:hypothetical protein [Chloroflexota bacterium]|tara:strand:+ start:1080 stop:1319 length:240 start_codon:yes stop_codon:yes gene_type:complete
MNASLNHALEKEVTHAKKLKLRKLKMVCNELEAAERKVDELRGVKWGLVTDLKNLGHDFTATTEGMDIVLSSSPSFNWS